MNEKPISANVSRTMGQHNIHSKALNEVVQLSFLDGAEPRRAVRTKDQVFGQQYPSPASAEMPTAPTLSRVKDTLGTTFVRFDGADYNPSIDDVRLSGQILRVFELMKDSRWRTLDEIARETGDPQASISAQLRHLRKRKFGSHEVYRQSRGDRSHGLYEYQLIVRRSI